MLRFIKKNKVILLFLLFILLYSITFMIFFIKDDKNLFEKQNIKNDEICTNYINSSIEEKQKLEENYSYDLNELCDLVINKEAKSGSFYIYYNYFIINNHIFTNFILTIIFTIFPVIYILIKDYKNVDIKTYLQRKSYKSYIFNMFKKSYIILFLIAFILLIYMLTAGIVSNFNFNSSVDLILYNLETSNSLLEDKSIILYLLSIFLSLGIYINMALIITRKEKRVLPSMIKTFISILILFSFVFIIIGLGYMQSIFNISAENFNIIELFYSGIDNYNAFLITKIVCYMVTLIISICVYKNKEKFILFCEE